MNKLSGTTPNLTELNTEKLKELFPQAVTEGKIDFDTLKSLLGEEVDDSHEKYQFTWHGKSKAIKLAQSPSTATLRPSKEDSKDWDTTENLYIEGDNLEVLKQLQKTYFGKIKMIYIDPPYNTGGDFVYKDDFKDTIKNYKEQTNQSHKANAETSGRYHTDWLNMMYPRLMLAKNLLSDDGVIFISIDNNEIQNLRKLCDEIYGENNFLAQLVWVKKDKASGVPPKRMILPNKEYILVYQRSKEIIFKGQSRSMKSYKIDDNGRFWRKMPIQATGKQDNYFTIIDPTNGNEYHGNWAFSKNRIEEMIVSGKISFPKNGIGLPTQIIYADEMKNENSPIFEFLGKFDSETSTKNLIKLLDGKKIFDFPKPVNLIKFLLKQVSFNEDIVLDYFSGSATTAHAVVKLNAEDGRNRKFIMVQLPELTDEKSEAHKAGYENICEIGKERIRRAGKQIQEEMAKDGKDTSNLDVGFKVFKLDSTNIKEWDSSQTLNEQTLLNYDNVFKDGRTQEDVLYEILLKYGVFNMPVKEIQLNDKTAYDVAEGNTLICLADDINEEDIHAIGKLKPQNVIFKESGFKDDNVKLNAIYTLEKQGVEDIQAI